MTTLADRLVLHFVFPSGLRPGDGTRKGNVLSVARNGRGQAVLRGTALAGALRHAYARNRGVSSMDDSVARWFGSASDESAAGAAPGFPSALVVPDVVLATNANAPLVVRNHVSIDRHTGAPRKRGLFQMEALPPNTKGTCWLEVHSEGRDGAEFLRALIGLFETGLFLGGSAARGIGMVRLDGPPSWREFDLGVLDDHAAYLDERYGVRRGHWPSVGKDIEPGATAASTLRIEVVLGIPRGQDFVVGGGESLDYAIEPICVRTADGSQRWVLPGSTLRGALRAWVTRLAAREGVAVADSLERRRQMGRAATGDEHAWCFMDKQHIEDVRTKLNDSKHVPGVRQLEVAGISCPVMRLFGTAHHRGRIHVTDSNVTRSGEPQARAHVAVDRITGGASEGFLFKNTVLVHDARVRFAFVITLDQPEEREVRWIATALAAIDRGIIRIGSAKAAGRLALVDAVVAKGPHAPIMTNTLTKKETRS